MAVADQGPPSTNSRPGTRRRRSREEREHLIRVFEEVRLSSTTTKEALRILGVPAATFYRWITAEERSYADSPLVDKGPDIGVNTAIRVLTSTNPEPVFEREQALFRIIAWLALGEDTTDQQAAVTSAHITYLCEKHHAETVQDLPADVRERLNRALRVDRLRWMFSPSSDYFSWLNDTAEFGTYSMHDVLAEIAHSLLTRPPNPRSRGYVSLTDAFRHQRGPRAECRYPGSERSLRSAWPGMAATAAFHLVLRRCTKLSLDLNPGVEGFNEYVDEALADPAALRGALSACKWAQRRLVEKLDPRALVGLTFPAFPTNLEEVIPPELEGAKWDRETVISL